jgi:hypothetical protein
MDSSATDISTPRAIGVTINDEALSLDLEDGRTIAVPLAWYPRLQHATSDERANWRFINRGSGIHWPNLDEDVSVAALLAGRRSAESSDSLAHWLRSRQ